jgi:uncharacterized protein YdaT
MPWTAESFRKHWKDPRRGKAARIANALLRKGASEGKAIRIAISQAKRGGR